MKVRAIIPMKLPSLNDYVRDCRANKYGANEGKRELEYAISLYLRKLPRFEHPIRIRFTWIEQTKRRDYDNVAFAKKFILDAMVKSGKLKDDNRRFVRGFQDDFSLGDDWGVILDIEEFTD